MLVVFVVFFVDVCSSSRRRFSSFESCGRRCSSIVSNFVVFVVFVVVVVPVVVVVGSICCSTVLVVGADS